MAIILACCFFFVSAFSYSVGEDRYSSESMDTSNGLRVIHIEPCGTRDEASGSVQGGDNVSLDSEWQCGGLFKSCWTSTKGSLSSCFNFSEETSFWPNLIGIVGLIVTPLFAPLLLDAHLLREKSILGEPSARDEELIEVGSPLTIIDPEDVDRLIAQADYHEKDKATHCVICLSGNAESLYGHRCNGESKDICLASIVCKPCSGQIKNKCPSCRKTYGDKEKVTASKKVR